jgi:hypothetical protein
VSFLNLSNGLFFREIQTGLPVTKEKEWPFPSPGGLF